MAAGILSMACLVVLLTLERIEYLKRKEEIRRFRILEAVAEDIRWEIRSLKYFQPFLPLYETRISR